MIAAVLSLLFGTAAAVAQTTSTSGSGSSSTGSSYGSGSSSSTDRSSSSARDDSGRSSSATSSTDQSSNPYNTSSGTTGSATTSGTSGTTSSTGATISSDTSTAGGATTMTGRESGGKLGWMERRWVNKVADAGTTEVSLAKLAAEKASNPEVKSFAQKLVDDHTKVNDELKSLASQKNVELDEEDLGSDRAHKRLSKKSGTDFDQEFIEQMVDMHEADVKLFEKAAQDGKDPALKSFAAKHVDHLRQHLQQAESLRSTIVPTGRMNDDSGRASTSSTSDTTGSTSTSSDATSGTSSSGSSGLTGGTGTSSGSGTGASDTSSSSSSDSTRRDDKR